MFPTHWIRPFRVTEMDPKPAYGEVRAGSPQSYHQSLFVSF